MSKKVHPYAHRLGIIRDWKSRWYSPKGEFKKNLKRDVILREFLDKRLRGMYVSGVEIERGVKALRIIIKAARPGLIIGRGGQGIEDLTKALVSALQELLRKRGVKNPKVPLSLNIEELKRSEVAAQFIAQSIAWDVERRLPFRRR